MDKKTAITLGIIVALMVVLITAVFVMDAGTEKVDKNTIITVENEPYTVQEFEQFAKILNYEESGDINIKMTETETLSMLDRFLQQKIYLKAAKSHDIVLDSGDIGDYSGDYDDDKDVYQGANVSKEYYVQYNTEKDLVEELQINFSEYYTLDDERYTTIKDSFEENDMYKTYEFRLMMIPYEVPTSGDEETDILEDESGETEDLSKEAQLKVAEDVLARIKSGESFEELSKEFGSTRLTFEGNQYTLVNGDKEYATSPLLESKLNNHEVYDKALEMNSGDISEIIDDEDDTAFYILKIESLQDGFVGEAEEELKQALLSELADEIVSEGIKFELNQSAYVRTMYK